VSYSARTVGSRDIRHLVAVLISPGALSAMELILPNTTEKKCGVASTTRKQIKQPPRKVSHVLMSSNA